jgi:hypothetical protein
MVSYHKYEDHPREKYNIRWPIEVAILSKKTPMPKYSAIPTSTMMLYQKKERILTESRKVEKYTMCVLLLHFLSFWKNLLDSGVTYIYLLDHFRTSQSVCAPLDQ